MAIREYGVTLAGVVSGEETLPDPTGPAAEQIYRRGRVRATLGVRPRKHRCAARRRNDACVCREAALDALTDADLEDVVAAKVRLAELQKHFHVPRPRRRRAKLEPPKPDTPEAAEEPQEAQDECPGWA